MSIKKIKAWYWVLTSELLFASSIFLSLSFFAEQLGIDCGGDWGVRRISTAWLGGSLGIIAIALWLPNIKTSVQTYRVAKFICYITKATLWIFIVFGLCELILQITPNLVPDINYEKDWGIVPSARSTLFFEHEGYGITHYLAHGEIETPFDDGNVSIVVLGDSHTEALQVSNADKFVSLAEINLRNKGKSVNLHNLGKSGASIPDYIYLAPIIKKYYKPDIVVVQLTAPDGIDGFVHENNYLVTNYFVINDKGNLELRHKENVCAPSWSSGLYKFKLRIISFSLAFNRYSKIIKMMNDQFHFVQPNVIDVRMDDQLKLLHEAYSDTQVILLLLPFSPNINRNNINFDDSAYFALLKSVPKNSYFYVINPKPEFDQMVKQGSLPRGFMNTLLGEGHLNVFGHKVIGKLLAEQILEILR